MVMYSERVLGNEAAGADGKRSPGRWGNLPPEQRCELAKKAVERVNRGKGWVINNPGDQGREGREPGGCFAVGPRKLSPGSRSGLSPDRGCRETPGVSCPGAPTFRSREGTPKPPLRSVRPGFSPGEAVKDKGEYESPVTLIHKGLGVQDAGSAPSSPSPRRPLLHPQSQESQPLAPPPSDLVGPLPFSLRSPGWML